MRLDFVLLAAIVIAPVHALGIELSLSEWDVGSGPLSTSLSVHADNNLCCGGQSSTLEPSFIPFGDSHLAGSGGVSAETGYQFSASGIEIGPISHFRLQRSAAISNGDVYFTVDEDGAYSLRGNYALTGGREVLLQAILWDLTDGLLLFESRQLSFTNSDQMLILGETQGDSVNVRSGAPHRMIDMGHVYRLSYRASIASSDSGDGDASAVGGISLVVLPEPSGGVQVGVIALLTVTVRRYVGRTTKLSSRLSC